MSWGELQPNGSAAQPNTHPTSRLSRSVIASLLRADDDDDWEAADLTLPGGGNDDEKEDWSDEEGHDTQKLAAEDEAKAKGARLRLSSRRPPTHRPLPHISRRADRHPLPCLLQLRRPRRMRRTTSPRRGRSWRRRSMHARDAKPKRPRKRPH